MSGYGGYEYDNANADSGGGGFLSQSNRESEGGEKEKKPRDKQTLTPVTIKQLQSAESGVGMTMGIKSTTRKSTPCASSRASRPMK